MDGDQKMVDAVEGSVHQTHNGGQYPHAQRPGAQDGQVILDLYVWEED